ncbi:hypothetical protein NEIMUCOT_04045 [Neisseria mucosa ATCC 25996]|uniref:Uncharacterized protein n=1 Tax=Neisseria mucosa (strain ATCC 25996 / DSM 4631 / NCTC 10774 / M26) TaxID=546266 RepID=D2ZTV7_NEIM2|nr:hypothetical protein NEIMUCOT_04045 [Neisseria mucosa ATCC 25996]
MVKPVSSVFISVNPDFQTTFPSFAPANHCHLSNPPEKAYNSTFIFEFIIFSDDLRQRKGVV